MEEFPDEVTVKVQKYISVAPPELSAPVVHGYDYRVNPATQNVFRAMEIQDNGQLNVIEVSPNTLVVSQVTLPAWEKWKRVQRSTDENGVVSWTKIPGEEDVANAQLLLGVVTIARAEAFEEIAAHFQRQGEFAIAEDIRAYARQRV